jgi:hypothetical protein
MPEVQVGGSAEGHAGRGVGQLFPPFRGQFFYSLFSLPSTLFEVVFDSACGGAGEICAWISAIR